LSSTGGKKGGLAAKKRGGKNLGKSKPKKPYAPPFDRFGPSERGQRTVDKGLLGANRSIGRIGGGYKKKKGRRVV